MSDLRHVFNPRYKILHDMIELLPDDGEWTQAEHDRWVNTFLVLLDMVTVIVPEEEAQREKWGQFYEEYLGKSPTTTPT